MGLKVKITYSRIVDAQEWYPQFDYTPEEIANKTEEEFIADLYDDMYYDSEDIIDNMKIERVFE